MAELGNGALTAAEAALGYARRGWFTFPTIGKVPLKDATPHGHLDATTDVQIITTWWRRWPYSGIGLACRPSGVVVVDVDPRNGGDDHLHDLQLQHGVLPDTVTSDTSRGGWHHFFARPDTDLTDRLLAPGVDVKANGYVVVPPSLHAFGGRYTWRIGYGPDELPLAPLPLWIVERLTSRNDQNDRRLRCDGTPLVITTGERNDRLLRIGCALRRYGIGDAALATCLEAINREHCRPPLGDREVMQIARSAARYPAVLFQPFPPFPTGDSRTDDLIARALGVRA